MDAGGKPEGAPDVYEEEYDEEEEGEDYAERCVHALSPTQQHVRPESLQRP